MQATQSSTASELIGYSGQFAALRHITRQMNFKSDAAPSVRKPIVVASLGDDLVKYITPDWNSYHLIIRGNVLMHILNGHLMCTVIDDDPVGRKFEGLIGVQVHVGGPMKIEYRNFRLKEV